MCMRMTNGLRARWASVRYGTVVAVAAVAVLGVQATVAEENDSESLTVAECRDEWGRSSAQGTCGSKRVTRSIFGPVVDPSTWGQANISIKTTAGTEYCHIDAYCQDIEGFAKRAKRTATLKDVSTSVNCDGELLLVSC